MLSRWVQTAAAPAPAGFDAEALDELLALGALFLTEDEQAIGAAPFCPLATDIAVPFPHETLYALSALDALAQPRLLGSAATIETRCPVPGQPISLQIDAQGIRFAHPSMSGRFTQTLGLAEAAAAAHAFYAFQRKMRIGAY